MNIHQEIGTLSDAAAVELLVAFVRSQPPDDTTPARLDAPLLENLTTAFGAHGEATPPVSEGELARAALLLLADAPEYAQGVAALIANPPPKQFMGVSGAAVIIPAVLIVLQTHLKFQRKPDGKWSLSIEKKPTDNELLKGLVKKLLGFA